MENKSIICNSNTYKVNEVKYNELEIGKEYIRHFMPCWHNDYTNSYTYMGELLEYTLSEKNNVVKIKFSKNNLDCNGIHYCLYEIINDEK